MVGPGSKLELRLGGKTLHAEIARDPRSRQVGLMHRESLPRDEGMLFVHEEREKVGYHMKNTLIPLAIAFIDDSGKILQIEHMKPQDARTTRSKYEVRFALEVNEGWFRDNGVEVGSSIENFPDVLEQLGVVL